VNNGSEPTRPPSPPAGEPAAFSDGGNADANRAAAEKGSVLDRLRRGLAKTRQVLTTDIEDLFARKKGLDEQQLEALEELLITSDIGVESTVDLLGKVSARASGIRDAPALAALLRTEVLSLLENHRAGPIRIGTRPHVVMVVGVNGVGKTTTIGKLARRYAGDGKKVLIAASDTFRAAAIEQLTIWAQRSGADIVRHRDGADPAAVAFDAMKAAIARKADVVLVDTAGRLHTKVNLMEELKKVKRSIAKQVTGAPNEILLVLDATTGQNALSQARMFNEALGVTGIALTKLDGTARGGIVVAIYRSLDIPLQYIGVGEKIDDLQVFEPETFVNALF
jgi:fused signal recognition particle receptor